LVAARYTAALLKIALVTYSGLPGLSAGDRLLQGELQRQGVEVVAPLWDDPAIRWSEFDSVVIRSCWDYHLRLAEFLAWVERLETQRVALWNPASLIRMNAHKAYLRAFESAGIPVVPTAWVEARSRKSLGEILGEREWTEAVVKPAVSASATGTWRVSWEGARSTEVAERFGSMARAGDLLVQRFLPEIASIGEWSFVFLAGEFSHAVLKAPAPGDFRVQAELGGRAVAQEPSASLIAQAKAVARVVPEPWLYARVDGVEVGGRLLLMEVELIEPELFLEFHPEAAARMARGLLRMR
jgi:glutathione synthase/RimK-type ligase-like ATP-grasp enzyme